MKHRPCPLCHSTDLEFTSNITYGHGDCGYTAWIECQNCGAQHGHVSDYGYPGDGAEHKAWCIWDGVKKEYVPKEVPEEEMTEEEKMWKRILDKYGKDMSIDEFLIGNNNP